MSQTFGNSITSVSAFPSNFGEFSFSPSSSILGATPAAPDAEPQFQSWRSALNDMLNPNHYQLSVSSSPSLTHFYPKSRSQFHNNINEPQSQKEQKSSSSSSSSSPLMEVCIKESLQMLQFDMDRNIEIGSVGDSFTYSSESSSAPSPVFINNNDNRPFFASSQDLTISPFCAPYSFSSISAGPASAAANLTLSATDTSTNTNTTTTTTTSVAPATVSAFSAPEIENSAAERDSPLSATVTNRAINYYPNFDPKEYFCDTVAVDNASMVAQIVGKKGAKIKHLVAKYGIRIRTPNLDQEPVFVIKGRRADVYRVKQEIVSAAQHFMRIEQTKRDKLNNVLSIKDTTSMKLFVPTRFVGLVIGRSGNIVRELQTAHKVYIETPKFELRQFFRIFGLAADIMRTIAAIKKLLITKSGIGFSEHLRKQDEIHLCD